MIINVACPSCDTNLAAGNETIGKVVPCTSCGELISVPAAHSDVGVIIGGFKLKERIGAGGMGEVYRARQLSMHRDVAVKILPRTMTADPDAVRRFLEEAKMSARLEHSNIVTIIDSGEDAGFYFLAMRFVEGDTLEHLLLSYHRIPEMDALGYMLKVVDALDFAWRHHTILHRDIKPSNIMLDVMGEVKLLDMGLAKCVYEDKGMTVSGVVMGTPFYMSPEQATGSNSLDFRSDMYSVGATLFHLIAGRPVFDGDCVLNIMTQHITDAPVDIREVCSGVSAPTAELIARTLNKHPDDRFESYAELRELIEAILEGRVERAQGAKLKRPAPLPAVTPKTLSQHITKVVAAIAMFIVIVQLGFILFAFRKGADEDNRNEVAVTETVPFAVNQLSVEEPERRMDEERVRETLRKVKWLVENKPNRRGVAVERCNELIAGCKGQPVQKEVEAYLATIEPAYQKELADNLFQIRKNSWALFNVGKSTEAIAYLMEYSGEMIADTRDMRLALAMEFQHYCAEKKRVPLKAPLSTFEPALIAAKQEIANHLIKQTFDIALLDYNRLLEKWPDQAHKDRIMAAFGGLEAICEMNDEILTSFKKSIAKAAVVQLHNQTVTMKILNVRGTVITGESRVKISRGREEKRTHIFRVSDLNAAERASRLKHIPDPQREVMKALLYLEIEKKHKAHELLTGNALPVAELISGILMSQPHGDPDIGSRIMRAVPVAQPSSRGEQADVAATTVPGRTLQQSFRDKMEIYRSSSKYIGNASLALGSRRIACLVLLQKLSGLDPKDGVKPRASQWYNELKRLAVSDKKTVVAAQETCLLSYEKLMEKLPADLLGTWRLDNQILTKLCSDLNMVEQSVIQHAVRTGLPAEVETRNTHIRLRLIPPGKFVMGCLDQNMAPTADETMHGVTLSRPMYVGMFEVTQRQWMAVMGHNPSRFHQSGLDAPVESVDWKTCRRFCELLCEKEDQPPGTYRLLTEAEWEYCCRAGMDTAYSAGNELTEKDANFNSLISYGSQRKGSYFKRTMAVGNFRSNHFGLHDMHGNVGEWVNDWYSRHYDEKRTVNPVGPDHGRRRIHRGGGWNSIASGCRSARRYPIIPTFKSTYIGLRIMRTVPQGHR